MQLQIEITNRFDLPVDANSLLYTPRPGDVLARRTKVYVCDIDGDPDAAVAWLERIILDKVSQHLHRGSEPALDDAQVIIDYGMKPGALDHEREMILDEFAHSGMDAGFTFDKLRLHHRIYLFSESGAVDPAPFVRDIINPAIHTHALHS